MYTIMRGGRSRWKIENETLSPLRKAFSEGKRQREIHNRKILARIFGIYSFAFNFAQTLINSRVKHF